MLPTMWNQFVTNERANISSIIATRPVIAGVRPRASAYTGLSLATNLKSTFFIDPNMPEAIELQSWSMNNEDYPARLTADTSNLTSSSRPTAPSTDTITKIDTIKNYPTNETNFWLKANAIVTNFQQNFCYLACPQCYKSTSTALDQLYMFSL